jgi:hypothetical protein
MLKLLKYFEWADQLKEKEDIPFYSLLKPTAKMFIIRFPFPIKRHLEKRNLKYQQIAHHLLLSPQ